MNDCDKAVFRSRSHAKSQLKTKKTGKGFRARIYLCDKCRYFHITNNDKTRWKGKVRWKSKAKWRGKTGWRNKRVRMKKITRGTYRRGEVQWEPLY